MPNINLPEQANKEAKMATGKQIEKLDQSRSDKTIPRSRDAVKNGLGNFSSGVTELSSVKSLIDTVVADAAAAGQNDYGLEQIQAGWSQNLRDVVAVDFEHAGKTGVSALAQLIADFSEQAGLEGGANELRLTAGGNVVPVSQDV